jgi:hypothetical protein
MERELNERNFSGRITSGITAKTLALKTIVFVHQQLPAWRDDPNRHPEGSENRLNLQLCKFLDSRARSDFPMIRFDHEEYQTERRSVDLSASPAENMIIEGCPYTIYKPILVLEGKRIPAPSLDREKEYVTGSERKSGGIQRFKLSLHGAKLDIAVIIGYVQDGSFGHWHETINRWISELATGTMKDECVWSNGEILEFLEEDKVNGVASYRSIHNRSTGDAIEIHHLWIVMLHLKK